MNCFSVKILAMFILATFEQLPTVASSPDFTAALRIVIEAKQQPGNINYADFCENTGRGASKFACQIKAMNDVGLLVCSTSFGCKDEIKKELGALEVIRNANLNVVKYYDPVIEG